MRKLLLLFILLISISLVFAQTAEAPLVGDGSSDNPYQIATLANLRWLSENSDKWASSNIYFIQTADIDASATQDWNDGAGFSPIGTDSDYPFRGNYNGNGKTISGLYIYRPSSNYQGLFGYINFYSTGIQIRDLGLIDVDISGRSYVGGMIGDHWNSTISNCYASGSVNGTNWYVGGLIGSNRGPISNCYASGSVSGDNTIGGLIGYNYYSNVSNCYASGPVSGTSNVGGFLGSNNSGTITACFWDTETSGQTTSARGTGMTTDQMKIQSTYTNWDFVEVWGMNSEINDGYPYLLSNVPDTPLPIALSAFSAVCANGSVKVTWVTESETENLAFRIYRDNEMIAELEGAGTTSEPQDYCYTDNHVIPGKTYTYVVADLTIGNKEVKHSYNAVTITVGEGNIGKDYSIGASYPNPFNPTCMIPLNLAESANVNAALYDLNGRLVKELYDGALSAGSHDLKIDGTSLATGIYLVKIQINDVMHVQKIALMK